MFLMISLARGTLPFHAITIFAWNSEISVFQTIPHARAVIFKFSMEVKRLLLRLVDSADICILLLSFLHQIISGLFCVVLPIPTQQDSRFCITPRLVWNATFLWLFIATKHFFWTFHFQSSYEKCDKIMACTCHVITSCYCLLFNSLAHKSLESSCSLQQGTQRIFS